MTNIAANPSVQRVTTTRLLGQSYDNSQKRYDRKRYGQAAAPKPVKAVKKSIDPVDAMVAGYNTMAMKAAGTGQGTAPLIPMPLMPTPVPAAPTGAAPQQQGPIGDIPSNAIREQMAKGILAGIGAQATPSNMQFMLAWMQAEGVNPKYYNPMGSTQHMAGSRPVPGNSAGVQIYPSMNIGINALVRTLTNGNYNEIVQGLRQSVNPLVIASSNQLNTWGTGGLIRKVLMSSMGGKK